VRRRLIQFVLPFLLCALPVLAAGAIASAVERGAREFYIDHLTSLDVIILSLGAGLFILQILFAYKALRWRGTSFDERPDPWLTNLAQAAEWFPLLGLLGTVAAILQTFSGITTFTPQEIIKNYAPAITATGSGLFMALVNIFPSWMVPVGRDLIRVLGGEREPETNAVRETTVAAPPVAARAESPRLARPHTGTDAGS
jgi:hypothetical protein